MLRGRDASVMDEGVLYCVLTHGLVFRDSVQVNKRSVGLLSSLAPCPPSPAESGS